MNLRIFILLFLLALGAEISFSQVNPGDTIDPNIPMDTDLNIEDAMTDSETDESVDWTYLTDFLEDLKSHPLNLNTASREELVQLPGMNEVLAGNLLAYIAEYGKLTTEFELQAVPGFTENLFKKLSPFVVVKESRDKDINADVLHPAGPGLQEVKEGIQHEFITRYIRQLEPQAGYEDPASPTASHYLGSPDKVYARWRSRYNRNVSLSLTMEKDQGEPFKWDPKSSTYGFDFVSGHAAIRDYGNLKALVIGDYNMRVGQGLILSNGLGFGKGGEAIGPIKRPNIGVFPTSSVNENQYLRGAAATYAIKKFYLTGFFSHTGRDANVIDADPLDSTGIAEIGNISSLQTSGLHRTEAEIADKQSIKETAYGGRVEYKSNRVSIGATHFFQKFNSNLVPANRIDNIFDFRGNLNYLSSVDFDFTFRNFNWFGEVGRSKSGGFGLTSGLMAALSPKVDLALSFRHFDKDFHSFKGYVFAERPTALQNETGMYTGLKIKFNPKFEFNAFFDQYWFPWNKYLVNYPSHGFEYLAQITYRPKKGTEFYVRARSDNKQRNASEFPDGQQLEYLINTQKNAFRLHFQTALNRNLTFRSRFEQSWYRAGDEPYDKGMLLYADLVAKIGYKFKLTTRYAIFDITDYNARIYAYENDLLGVFAFTVYGTSGHTRGTRYHGMLQYSPNRNVDLWLKVAQWRYDKVRSLGSSLTEVQGNTRTNVSLQMRWSF
ncbi:MAG: helix-hairpin-helix domain-containing protein [Bacteroidia bacterium]|nr:helix-hairpin-helix domain-containing protein [Bacteroidia bacterium]